MLSRDCQFSLNYLHNKIHTTSLYFVFIYKRIWKFTQSKKNKQTNKKILTKHFGKNKKKTCKQFYWQRGQNVKTQSTYRKTNITQKVHSIFKTRKQFSVWGGAAVGPLSSTVNTPQYLSAFFNTILLQKGEALRTRRCVLSQYWTVKCTAFTG